jgi:hypothetical protein
MKLTAKKVEITGLEINLTKDEAIRLYNELASIKLDEWEFCEMTLLRKALNSYLLQTRDEE